MSEQNPQTSQNPTQNPETQILANFACALDEYGFETELFQLEDNAPVLLNADFVLGGQVMNFIAMFMHREIAGGPNMELLNIFFKVAEELPHESFDRLKEVCNHINGNIPVGTFLVQENHSLLSYKQSVSFQRTRLEEESLVEDALTTARFMREMLGRFYPAIQGCVGGLTLDELIAQGALPQSGR